MIADNGMESAIENPCRQGRVQVFILNERSRYLSFGTSLGSRQGSRLPADSIPHYRGASICKAQDGFISSV